MTFTGAPRSAAPARRSAPLSPGASARYRPDFPPFAFRFCTGEYSKKDSNTGTHTALPGGAFIEARVDDHRPATAHDAAPEVRMRRHASG